MTCRSPLARADFDYEAMKDKVIDCPYDIMVVFACIMQFHDMALLFWSRCKEPIVSGLIAAKINWLVALVTILNILMSFFKV